jgi:hypothetical protein
MSTSAESSITPQIAEAPQDIVEFFCSGISIHAKFVTDNPDVAQHVKDAFPVSTLTDHVLTAGETILFPFPITYLGKGKRASRLPGTVYCNLGSKALAICYGEVKQAGTVNEIATVLPEDMEKLRTFGKLAKENTQMIQTPLLVKTHTRMFGDFTPQPILDDSIPAPEFDGAWQSALKVIEWHTARLNGTEEPDEMKAIRLGAIEKANTDWYLSNFFGMTWLTFIRPHLVPWILTAATKYNYSFEQKKGSLDEALFGNFNHFTFLSGHGLKELGEMGSIYGDALKNVETNEQLDRLTASFRSYLAVTHRWLQRVFSWHLNKQFPKPSLEEFAAMPKPQSYVEFSME